MSSGEKVRLGDVITIEKADAPQGESVWMLNLDAVEKNTGRVLEKAMVAPSEVGTSTVPFSSKAVLYSKLRPNLNKVVMPDESGFATSEMLPLVADSNVLDRRYLAAFLRSRVFVNYAVASTAGAKMPRVSKKTVLDAKIRLPEFHAQVKRAGTFSALESQIETVEQQIAQLDQLVKSRFVEMFGDPIVNPKGWTVSTIKETAVTYGDGPFGSNLKTSDYVETGVRVIRLGNIAQGKFLDKDKSFISNEKYLSLKKYVCKPGEVVIATLGEPLLRACLVPDFGTPCIHKADCMYYETNKNELLPVFAMCALNQPSMLQKAMEFSHGQTRARINSSQTGNLPMIVPPLALQQDFAAFAAQVDKTRAIAQQQINKLQTLYDSLAQDYFA